MSPLRLEAVYERIPQGWQPGSPAHVRWGVRASLGGTERGEAPQETEASREPEATRALQPALPAGRVGARRGPRVGPRELPEPEIAPHVLAYGPDAREIALFEPEAGAQGRHLDLIA